MRMSFRAYAVHQTANTSNRFAWSRDVTAAISAFGDGRMISAQRTNKRRYWISFLKLSYFVLLWSLVGHSCWCMFDMKNKRDKVPFNTCYHHIYVQYIYLPFRFSPFYLLASDDQIFWLMPDECAWNRCIHVCAITSECRSVRLSAVR